MSAVRPGDAASPETADAAAAVADCPGRRSKRATAHRRCFRRRGLPDQAGQAAGEEGDEAAQSRVPQDRRTACSARPAACGGREQKQHYRNARRAEPGDYPRGPPASGYERQALDFYRQNPEAVASLRAPIFEDKVVDFIVELAKVPERRVSPQELLALPEPDSDDAVTGDAVTGDPATSDAVTGEAMATCNRTTLIRGTHEPPPRRCRGD